MSTEQDAIDITEFDRQQRPTGLNVLTILSVIWSVFQILSSIWGFMKAKKDFDEKEKVLAQLSSPEMPAWVKKMTGTPEEFLVTVTKSYENRIPIAIMGLIAAALCLYGVIQMRNLKKEGFLFYTIGELLPFLSMFFFLGIHAATGMIAIFFFVLALIFIALYASYRKEMIY